MTAKLKLAERDKFRCPYCDGTRFEISGKPIGPGIILACNCGYTFIRSLAEFKKGSEAPKPLKKFPQPKAPKKKPKEPEEKPEKEKPATDTELEALLAKEAEIKKQLEKLKKNSE